MFQDDTHPDFAVQPIVSITRTQILGHEFLFRMHGPGGMMHPESVIATADEHGILSDVDQHLFAAALAMIDDPIHGPGYINLFPTTIYDDKAMEAMAATIGRGSNVVVELSEKARIADWKAVMPRVRELQQSGVSFALDDFGAGTSNIIALSAVAFDYVKFDKDLVHAAREDNRARALMESAVAMCADAGCMTVAEGIETPADEALAKAAGFGAIQGFGIAEPMRVSEHALLVQSGSKGVFSNLCPTR